MHLEMLTKVFFFSKSCQIGRKGAEFIGDMIKYNTTISTLDLRANGLMDEVSFFIDYVLQISWIYYNELVYSVFTYCSCLSTLLPILKKSKGTRVLLSIYTLFSHEQLVVYCVFILR